MGEWPIERVSFSRQRKFDKLLQRQGWRELLDWRTDEDEPSFEKYFRVFKPAECEKHLEGLDRFSRMYSYQFTDFERCSSGIVKELRDEAIALIATHADSRIFPVTPGPWFFAAAPSTGAPSAEHGPIEADASARINASTAALTTCAILDLLCEERMVSTGDNDIMPPVICIDPDAPGLSTEDRKWAIVQEKFWQSYIFFAKIGRASMFDRYTAQYKFSVDHLVNEESFDFRASDSKDAVVLGHVDVSRKSRMYKNWHNKYGDPGALVDELIETPKGKLLAEKYPQWVQWFHADDKEEKRLLDLIAARGRVDRTPAELAREHPLRFPQHSKWAISAENSASFDSEESWGHKAGGVWAMASSCDGCIFLWPCEQPDEEQDCVRICQAHAHIATDMVADFGKMRSCSVGLDNVCALTDLAQGKVIARIRDLSRRALCRGSFGTRDSATYMLTCDSDGERAVIGCADGYLKVGDFETEKLIVEMHGHTDDIYHVKAGWERSLVVTGSWDRTCGMYDLRAGRRVRLLRGHNFVVNRVAVDFSKQLLLSVAREDQFILWDLKEGAAVRHYQGEGTHASDVCVNWETMTAALACVDKCIRFFDLAEGECLKRIDHDHDMTTCMDVNWERNLLLAGSWDYKCMLFDIQTGLKLKALQRRARRTLTQVCIRH